tara:strand:- start:205 stop:498 length:294 start_codon:yes stop_codon:yes gene_type:complete
MITFFSKSLVSLVVISALWVPTEAWVGAQKGAGLTCRADFSACSVAGTVIPLVDRSTVLGQIAEQARNHPAEKLEAELRLVTAKALDGVRAAARAKE